MTVDLALRRRAARVNAHQPPLKQPPPTPELIRLARRLFWWKEPDQALAYPSRFLAQVMALGTWDDVKVARSYWSEDEFREVLQSPPAGVFDARSWSYWHYMLGVLPVPRLPGRLIP